TSQLTRDLGSIPMLPIASHAIPKNESTSTPAPSSSDTGRSGKLLKDNTVPKPDKYNGTPDWHTYRAFSHNLMIYFRLSGLPSEFHVYYMTSYLTSPSANLLCVSSLDVNLIFKISCQIPATMRRLTEWISC
ncbi:hypothetical protein SISSUDRAFT_1056398, partial [Sistotremastrum suecicum HHB10207 ss-3]